MKKIFYLVIGLTILLAGCLSQAPNNINTGNSDFNAKYAIPAPCTDSPEPYQLPPLDYINLRNIWVNISGYMPGNYFQPGFADTYEIVESSGVNNLSGFSPTYAFTYNPYQPDNVHCLTRIVFGEHAAVIIWNRTSIPNTGETITFDTCYSWFNLPDISYPSCSTATGGVEKVGEPYGTNTGYVNTITFEGKSCPGGFTAEWFEDHNDQFRVKLRAKQQIQRPVSLPKCQPQPSSSPHCPTGQEYDENGVCVPIVKPEPSNAVNECEAETPYSSEQIADVGKSLGITNAKTYGVKMYTSNTKLTQITEAAEQLEKTVDKIIIAESKLDNVTGRNLSSKVSEIQSEINNLNVKRLDYENFLAGSTTSINNLVTDVRTKINTLIADPSFSTGYETKPADIDSYESSVIFYDLYFQNALDGQVIGKDTYQLFDTADILTEEYQLLKDLITDYQNGTIPVEDKDYTVSVMKSLTEQMALHSGTVEHIANKLAVELERLDKEIIKDFSDYQKELKKFLILDKIARGELNPSNFGVSANPEPNGEYTITVQIIDAVDKYLNPKGGFSIQNNITDPYISREDVGKTADRFFGQGTTGAVIAETAMNTALETVIPNSHLDVGLTILPVAKIGSALAKGSKKLWKLGANAGEKLAQSEKKIITKGKNIEKNGKTITKSCTICKLIEDCFSTLSSSGSACRLWTKTKKKSVVQNAWRHWNDHKKDFPKLNNIVEYVKEAKKFTDHPPSTAHSKIRANGDKVVYDPVTDVFGVQDINGVPRTMYIPEPSVHGYPTNLDYYLAQ